MIMEDVFQEVRSDRVKVTSDMIDLLFRCLDAIEAYLDCIKESSDEGTEDNESLIQGLNTFLAKRRAKKQRLRRHLLRQKARRLRKQKQKTATRKNICTLISLRMKKMRSNPQRKPETKYMDLPYLSRKNVC